MLSAANVFYRECGVGTLGLHKAFRLKTSGDLAEISPISGIADVRFDDLVGYEQAKKQLRDNTESFLRGKPANNCLLYGDAGTGKSSSIKALANVYYGMGPALRKRKRSSAPWPGPTACSPSWRR